MTRFSILQIGFLSNLTRSGDGGGLPTVLAFFLTLIAAMCLDTPAAACGLDWTIPKSHFNGVDYRGYVYVVEKLGAIQGEDSGNIPIIATFGSKRKDSSVFAGYGWEIPLLESRLVQVDERSFELNQPDGRFRQFWRDSKNPRILNGQGGFKAEIRGDTISVWADCGSKMTFHKGRITSLETSRLKLFYDYEEGRLVQIRNGAGHPVLSIVRNGEAKSASLNLNGGERIELVLSQRPRLQEAGGQMLIGSVEEALGGVVRADGSELQIDYPMDERSNPVLKIGDRRIVWDGRTQLILRDEDPQAAWHYEVRPGEGRFANAAISRKNIENATELWHRDEKGVEVIKNGEVEIRKSSFTSGKLAGRPRAYSKTSVKDGSIVTEFRYSYDELGRLKRKTFHNGEVEEFFYEGNKLARATVTKGPQMLSERLYDESGRPTVAKTLGVITRQVFYPKDGEWQTPVKAALAQAARFVDVGRVVTIDSSILSGKAPQFSLLDSNGTQVAFVDWNGNVLYGNKEAGKSYINGLIRKLAARDPVKDEVKIELYDAAGNIASTQTATRPDARTRLTKIKTASGREDFMRIKYDSAGRVIEHASKKGTYHYTYLADGTRNEVFEESAPKKN